MTTASKKRWTVCGILASILCASALFCIPNTGEVLGETSADDIGKYLPVYGDVVQTYIIGDESIVGMYGAMAVDGDGEKYGYYIYDALTNTFTYSKHSSGWLAAMEYPSDSDHRVEVRLAKDWIAQETDAKATVGIIWDSDYFEYDDEDEEEFFERNPWLLIDHWDFPLYTTFGDGVGFEHGVIEIPFGASVKLDLNGHVIDRALNEYAQMFGQVIYGEGCQLEIVDSNPETEHKNNGADKYAYTDADGQTVAVNGGIITGSKVKSFSNADITGSENVGRWFEYDSNNAADRVDNGGVYIRIPEYWDMGINDDNLRLEYLNYMRTHCGISFNGGTVYGNQTKNLGGMSVFSSEGYLVFDGGKVINNSAYSSDVEYNSSRDFSLVDGDVLIMLDGEISYNYTQLGMIISTYTLMRIDGGVISHNTVDSRAHVYFYVDEDSRARYTRLYGGAIIEAGAFQLYDGEIFGNVINNSQDIDQIIINTTDYEDDDTDVGLFGSIISLGSTEEVMVSEIAGGKIHDNSISINQEGKLLPDAALTCIVFSRDYDVRNSCIMSGGEIYNNTIDCDAYDNYLYDEDIGEEDRAERQAKLDDKYMSGYFASAAMYTESEFTMTGGSIHDNSKCSGFAVYNPSWAKKAFRFTGGEIYNNSTGFCGGGIYVSAYPSYNLADGFNQNDVRMLIDGTKIYENTAKYGGGVFARKEFVLVSGEIKNNSAQIGGGVYYFAYDSGNGHSYDMNNIGIGGGSITGNVATEKCGGIYVHENYHIGRYYWSDGDFLIPSRLYLWGSPVVTGNVVGATEEDIQSSNIEGYFTFTRDYEEFVPGGYYDEQRGYWSYYRTLSYTFDGSLLSPFIVLDKLENAEIGVTLGNQEDVERLLAYNEEVNNIDDTTNNDMVLIYDFSTFGLDFAKFNNDTNSANYNYGDDPNNYFIIDNNDGTQTLLLTSDGSIAVYSGEDFPEFQVGFSDDGSKSLLDGYGVKYTYDGNATAAFELNVGDEIITPDSATLNGEDFDLGESISNAGIYKLNYTVSGIPLTYTIVVLPKALIASDVTVKLENDKDEFEYVMDSEIAPTVAEITTAGGVTLTEGKDFTVSYRNNLYPGTGYAVITYIGNYSGVVEVPFSIIVTGEGYFSVEWEYYDYSTGVWSATAPAYEFYPGERGNQSNRIRAKLTAHGVDLPVNVYYAYAAGVENYLDSNVSEQNLSTYIVEYVMGGNSVWFRERGEYTVSIVGDDILPIPGAEKPKLSITNYEIPDGDTKLVITVWDSGLVYDGKAKTPRVYVVYDALPLTTGVDYDVVYSDGENESQAILGGECTVSLVFKGNYAGIATANFTIGPADNEFVNPISIVKWTYGMFNPSESVIIAQPKFAKGGVVHAAICDERGNAISVNGLSLSDIALSVVNDTTYGLVYTVADSDVVELINSLDSGLYILKVWAEASSCCSAIPVQSLTFDIKQSANSWVVSPSIVEWAYGSFDEAVNLPVGEGLHGGEAHIIITDGNQTVWYDNANDVNKLADMPAGAYTFTARVAESENYSLLEFVRAFAVNQAENRWSEIPGVVTWTVGEFDSELNTPTGAGVFGGNAAITIVDTEDGAVWYDSANGINKLSEMPVGSYYLSAYIAGTASYTDLSYTQLFKVFEADTVINSGLPWWAVLLIVLGALLFVALIVFILHRAGVFQILSEKMVVAIRAKADIDATIAAVRAGRVAAAAAESVATSDEMTAKQEEEERKEREKEERKAARRAAALEAKARTPEEKAAAIQAKAEEMKRKAAALRAKAKAAELQATEMTMTPEEKAAAEEAERKAKTMTPEEKAAAMQAKAEEMKKKAAELRAKAKTTEIKAAEITMTKEERAAAKAAELEREREREAARSRSRTDEEKAAALEAKARANEEQATALRAKAEVMKERAAVMRERAGRRKAKQQKQQAQADEE